jgi:hypothetical protein
MQPKTIDLKPIGYLNPARRPIAQTGQHGLSLITELQFVAAGPISSRDSTNDRRDKARKSLHSGKRRETFDSPNFLYAALDTSAYAFYGKPHEAH